MADRLPWTIETLRDRGGTRLIEWLDNQGVDTAGLAQTRRRGLTILAVVAGLGAAGFVIVAGAAYLTLIRAWLDLIDRARVMFGFARPTGPDWLLVASLVAALAAPLVLVAIAYRYYLKEWRRRAAEVWPETRLMARFGLIRPLPANAGPSRMADHEAYLQALGASPAWAGTPVTGIFARIEQDVAMRALATGLIVGVSRRPLIDLLTIAGAALELQIHVLSRLGKRPNLRVWLILLQRTGASLFFNTYLNRDQLWELTLAVKKAALGLQAVGEVSDQVSDWLANVDPDEYLDALPDQGTSGMLRAGAEVALSASSFAMGVGAAGVRQIAVVIDRYGDDLIEGILAGGILYYHGISLAADCLAVDRAQRASADWNRTPYQATAVIASFAGGILRKHVREYRAVLREKRRQLAGAMAQKFGQTGAGAWSRVKQAIRRTETPS